MAHKAQHSKGKSAPRSSRRKIEAAETGTVPAAAPSVSPSPTVAPRVATAPRGAAVTASAFATSYPYIKKELVKIAVVTVAVIVVLVLISLFWR